MNIYLASSHRNATWSPVKAALEAAGHHVYDWKEGFHYGDTLPPDIDHVPVAVMQSWVRQPSIIKQLDGDVTGIALADVLILLLPAGADAHTEMGLAFGMQIPVYVLVPDGEMRAGLFYGLARGIFDSIEDLIGQLENSDAKRH